MKKWKQLGLATATLASVFILGACGSGNAESKDGKTEITFSHWGGDDAYKNIYKDRIAAFEKENPDIKVKVISIASDYDTKLLTMYAGKEAPDVAQVAEAGQNFASKTLFEDLTPYIKEAGIDTEATWADALTQYTWEGKPFALPDRGGPEIMYYNKDMFDAAGVDYPTADWTIEDYTKAMEKLTLKEGDKTIQYGASGLDWTPNWGVMMNSNGGEVMKDGKLTIDSKENLEVLDWYNDIYQKGYVLTYQELENVKNSNADSMFSQGKVATLTTGFWNIASFSALDDLNYDIAPMPSFSKQTTWPFGSALAMSKDSKHKEAAFKFMNYMTDVEAQTMLGDSLGDCPANLKVLNSAEFNNRQINGKDLNLEAIGISASRVKIDGVFQGPYYSEITALASAQVKEMLLGRLTPAEAIDVIQKRGEKILKMY